MSRIYSFMLVLLFASSALFAQYTISGKVTDARNGEPLIGANVFIKSISTGAATLADGQYSFKVDEGKYTVTCSYIGYEQQQVVVNVTNSMELNFLLQDYEFSLSVTVIADRAKERETPVAFSNVEKKDVEMLLGSQDIPMALNSTPSLFATMQGGGAGDARVNVRGFNQRNVAIMINGVPINDMENGWVYWSNWDGVGDATSSIQVQRGLSAVNLATPSIGGTMNVVTDPTAAKFGVKYKQEFGNDNFYKSTLAANTGLIDGKWAVSAVGVRKVGDGLIDKTWTDAWAYYLGAAYNIDNNNRVELYALGAPQRHGQNSYRLNPASYSHDFASGLSSYSPAGLEDPKLAELGRKFNPNWNTVDPTYKGQQYWNGSTHERYDSDFINERENYFHKPVINLNYYTKLSDMVSSYTTVYYSGGTGGGSGTLGSLVWDYSHLQRVADWDGTIARNQNNLDANNVPESRGILRNSVNNQWTVGAISKVNLKIDENLTAQAGIDWRTAEIDHFREVRDLLGGQYFTSSSNEFDNSSQYKKKLGDKVDYHNTNTVDWFGFFGQAEYTTGPFTFYGTYGWSTIKYTYVNHFATKDTLKAPLTYGLDTRAIGDPDPNSGKLEAETEWINGFQVKGGLLYRASELVDVYGNAGYVAKVPIFDAVIDDGDGTVATDPENEKFLSFEGGVNFTSPSRNFSVKVNYYNTLWQDRTFTRFVQIGPNQEEGIAFLKGVDQRHSGVEFESYFQPLKYVRLDASVSFGSWKYTNDVSATYKTYDNGQETSETDNLYINDLKVGDAPQTQMVFALSLYPVDGLRAQFVTKYYKDYYADFDPLTRNNQFDRRQSWLLPSATVCDLHATYELPLNLSGVQFEIFAHVFNIFDEIYVQDATDNSGYNAYSANGKHHSADDAEVFLGLPRSFNVGVSLTY